LFGIAVIIFMLNKLYVRKWILENDLPEYLLIVSYSIPNLIEAIIVTLLLTGILLQVRQYFNKKFGLIKTNYIHIIASSLAAVYVITQELKFHNLGGNNVYDPNDLWASIVGLVGTFVMMRLFGFTEQTQMETTV